MEPEFGYNIDFEEISRTNAIATSITFQSETLGHVIYTPSSPVKIRESLVDLNKAFVDM